MSQSYIVSLVCLVDIVTERAERTVKDEVHKNESAAARKKAICVSPIRRSLFLVPVITSTSVGHRELARPPDRPVCYPITCVLDPGNI